MNGCILHAIVTGESWRPQRARRGGILFEVMLSIALFVGAAAFTLGATRSVFSGLERAQREQQAVDLARSIMAELELGLTSLENLRGERVRRIGTIELDADERDRTQPVWRVEVNTQPTAYTGLTLIELTVHDAEAAGEDADRELFTLRQLIRLREEDPGTYEEDDLLEGLPESPEDDWW